MQQLVVEVKQHSRNKTLYEVNRKWSFLPSLVYSTNAWVLSWGWGHSSDEMDQVLVLMGCGGERNRETKAQTGIP